jgi:hypothetical protein
LFAKQRVAVSLILSRLALIRPTDFFRPLPTKSAARRLPLMP